MREITVTGHSSKVGVCQSVAQRQPVGETMPVSAAEYQRPTRRRRRSFLIEHLPEEDWKAIETAYAALGEPDPGK